MAFEPNSGGSSQRVAFGYIAKMINAIFGAIWTSAQHMYSLATSLKPKETFVCVLLVIIWVSLFAIGATVDSASLLKNLTPANFFVLLPAIAITYAYSNIAFLSLVSGALGGLLSNLSLNNYAELTGEKISELAKGPQSKSVVYQNEPPIASAVRSFAVYLMYIAGISIVVPGATVSGAPLTVDASQYVRLAGIISALGFAVGYDPTIFAGIFARLNLGGTKDSSAGGAQTVTPKARTMALAVPQPRFLDVQNLLDTLVPPTDANIQSAPHDRFWRISPTNTRDGFINFDTSAWGPSGPLVTPGDPTKSNLFLALAGQKPFDGSGVPQMPDVNQDFNATLATPAQLALIETWIKNGAPA
jgi:hypothetical protein